MNKIIDYLKNFKELYILATFVIGLGTSLFLWGWNIESNQMYILKSIVHEFEIHQKCNTNRYEYDEYIVNYTSLFNLSKRHGLIGKNAPFNPVKRKEKCKK
jgi:hypothetical protein